MSATDWTAEEAEQYLRRLGKPEDTWLLSDGRPWWLVSQLEGHLFGLDAESIRRKLAQGLDSGGAEGIPDGVLMTAQMGWRVPRSGLLIFLARVRQGQEQRAQRRA